MSSGLEAFEPGFLRRLERLAVVARRTLRGVGQGERRSKRHGGTVEFSDYRAYTPGDDTRRVDWYAYARFEQLFLKLYVEEQDLAVHLLLDQSASMGAGTPAKLPYARSVAAALAYIALAAGDRVTVRAFRGGELAPQLGPLRGRGALLRLVRFLAQDPEPAGRTSLAAAVRTFVGRKPTPGVVVVLSDLLDPEGYREPLQRLRHSGYEPTVVHVVAPDEAAPAVDQDLDLVCAETGAVLAVDLDGQAVAEYRAAFAAFEAEAQAFCSRHDMGYVQARTSVPFEELVLQTLRRRGLLA